MQSLAHRFQVRAAVFCLVAACGGKQPSEPEPSTPAPVPTPAPSSPAPSPTTPPASQPSAADAPAPAPSAAAATDPKPAAPHDEASRKAPDSQPNPSSPLHVEKSGKRSMTGTPEATAPSAPPARPSPAASATAPGASAASGPCGEKGQPHCPLQAWMEDHLQTALEHSDAPALAKGLTRVAIFTPDPSWNAGPQGWAALANAGADAARKGDITATKVACKSCHKAWRAKYKQAFRKNPIAD